MFAPLDALFDSVGVRFVKGTATGIDEQARTVRYRDEDGREAALGYDRLVLAAGSQLARPPVPGLTPTPSTSTRSKARSAWKTT